MGRAQRVLAAAALACVIVAAILAAALALPGEARAATYCPPTVREGMYNDAWVWAAQNELNDYFRFDPYHIKTPYLVEDGDFGPRTEEAVVHFQQDMRETDPGFLVDGIVGPQTWRELFEEEGYCR